MHHITLIGSNRQDTIDFYQGVLGMPLVFEQPNLDVPEETHVYFGAGDAHDAGVKRRRGDENPAVDGRADCRRSIMSSSFITAGLTTNRVRSSTTFGSGAD